MLKRLATAVIAVLALAAALIPAAAQARDRNHDRIPDKWEKRHHLSLRHDQARRDQDRDGLRNLSEYRQKTDPRDDDSDNDGLEDGDEQALGHDPSDDDGDNDGVEDGDELAGTVASYSGGVLTITLAAGGQVSGTVTSATEIDCHAADDEGDDDGEDGDDGDDQGGDDQGDDRRAYASDGDDDHSSAGCGAALVAGARVHEADLKVGISGSVFDEVELLG